MSATLQKVVCKPVFPVVSRLASRRRASAVMYTFAESAAPLLDRLSAVSCMPSSYSVDTPGVSALLGVMTVGGDFVPRAHSAAPFVPGGADSGLDMLMMATGLAPWRWRLTVGNLFDSAQRVSLAATYGSTGGSGNGTEAIRLLAGGDAHGSSAVAAVTNYEAGDIVTLAARYHAGRIDVDGTPFYRLGIHCINHTTAAVVTTDVYTAAPVALQVERPPHGYQAITDHAGAAARMYGALAIAAHRDWFPGDWTAAVAAQAQQFLSASKQLVPAFRG